MSGTAKEGKKGKKPKGKVTLSLNAFLGTKNVPDGFDKKVVNWADAMEDDDMNEMPMPKFRDELKEVILPTAPKASRPNEIDTSRVPNGPPFKAYIGNISYGAGEDDLKTFFDQLLPIQVQLPRDDKGTGRPRGFGYIEFESRDLLIEALKMNGKYLKDRPLKVSLPDEGGRDSERRDRGPMSMGDEDRTAGDWRKAPRPEQQQAPQQQQFSSAPRPDMSREMAGPWRSSSNTVTDAGRGVRDRNGYDNPPARSYEPAGGASRYEPPRGDDRRPPGGAFSDRRTGGFDSFTRGQPREGGFENSYRDSYRDAPRQASRYQDEHDRRPGYSERPDYDRGSDFDRFDRSGPPRTGGTGYDRPSQGPPASRSDGYHQETSAPPAEEAPKTRPKLQLQPRSKPLEEIAAPAPVASKSIFGDAKPVDTAKKELEVEEKMKSLDVKDSIGELTSGRPRTISSGSGSTGTRSRKESESDRTGVREDTRQRRNDNFPPRDGEFARRSDRAGAGSDRTYDNRDRRPAFGNDRRPVDRQDDRRRNDRAFQDRPPADFNRRDERREVPRDDRRDDRGPVRPRPDDDRRPAPRPDFNRERDNNNGVAKREAEYTMKNKYDALNDDEYEASTRYTTQD